MAGDKVCDDMTVLLQNDTLWIPTAHGAESMVNFENIGGGDAVKEEFGDDDFDLGINRKKRRLSASQVQHLEKHFEVENKLEPERKSQLAMELGLQQRQVAIWFQNRRARSKTKQLEKDYDSLKFRYDKLKLDYDILLKEKENLNNQFVALKEKVSKGEEKVENVEKDAKEAMVCLKQVDGSTNSGKSDVLDSDSPQSYLDPVGSGRVFESEFSQDEGDGLSRSLFSQHPANFEFSGEDQPFWCWGF